MPEVTILPDGLQVTAGEGETVLAATGRYAAHLAEHELKPRTRLRKVLGFAYPNAAPPHPAGRPASNPATRNDRKERIT